MTIWVQATTIDRMGTAITVYGNGGNGLSGNRDIPTVMRNSFDMRGNVNEHQGSRGILDCITDCPKEGNDRCTFDFFLWHDKCLTLNKDRRTESPVPNKFELLFKAADNITGGTMVVMG